MRSFLLCLVLLLTPEAQAQPVTTSLAGLMPEQARQVADLIDHTVKSGYANKPVSLRVTPTISLSLTPGLFTSRANDAICNRCTDFCRTYTLEVRREDTLSISTFSGERCIARPNTAPDSGPWVNRRPLTFTDSRWLVASQDLDDARRALVTLKYVHASATAVPFSMVNALAEFRADARMPDADARRIIGADLAALREAVARSAVPAACQRGAAYTACRRLD